MKTNRILNTIAFLSMFMVGNQAFAQDALTPTEARMNATAEAVFHENLKNSAGAPANALATLAGTRSASLSLSEQNAVSHQQAMNQISAKMIAQTTVVGATEGSKAVETVQEAGDAATMATLMTMFNAILQAQKVNAQ